LKGDGQTAAYVTTRRRRVNEACAKVVLKATIAKSAAAL
jgi:hypothetical protein